MSSAKCCLFGFGPNVFEISFSKQVVNADVYNSNALELPDVYLSQWHEGVFNVTFFFIKHNFYNWP